MRTGATVLLGAALGLTTLVGCADHKTVDVSTTVGHSLADAYVMLGYPGELPVDRYRLLLTPLEDVPGKTGPTNTRDDPATLVVLATCIIDSSEPYITSPPDPNGPSAIALGLAPIELATPAVRERAKRGEFQEDLVGGLNCREDGSMTATYR
ncbi:MAG: hypothetical protein GX542_12635 [Rhodococcus sp.]|nr:hypothetical protein [Rhodococcus sp. (in: high G+C Gram-positive bacteria)]